MEVESAARLPLTHPQRIKARDLKLQQRDEQRAIRNALCRYRCPCNLCGGRRRPYKSTTVARHLRHRGRHGALRGWTHVTLFLHTGCGFLLARSVVVLCMFWVECFVNMLINVDLLFEQDDLCSLVCEIG